MNKYKGSSEKVKSIINKVKQVKDTNINLEKKTMDMINEFIKKSENVSERKLGRLIIRYYSNLYNEWESNSDNKTTIRKTSTMAKTTTTTTIKSTIVKTSTIAKVTTTAKPTVETTVVKDTTTSKPVVTKTSTIAKETVTTANSAVEETSTTAKLTTVTITTTVKVTSTIAKTTITTTTSTNATPSTTTTTTSANTAPSTTTTTTSAKATPSTTTTTTIEKTTTTTTTKTVATPTSSTSNDTSGKYIIGYWDDWKAANYPVSSIPFDSITHINYAFALIDPNTIELTFDGNLLKSLTTEAAKHNVKVLLSIGGWYGSRDFTKVTASSEKIRTLVKNCKKVIDDYGVAGIDIDWEYPGAEGACNNPDKANDVKQYINLLTELRNEIGNSALISIAVSVEPFKENDGPANLTKMAEVLDYIVIMGYDFNGGWSAEAMHHANLQSPNSNELSVKRSVDLWNNAGFDSNKIIIGIPAYGRSFKVTTSNNYGLHQVNTKEKIQGDQEDVDQTWVNYCNIQESGFTSIWKYKNIRKTILVNNYETPVKPWERYYDSAYEAPVLFNPETKVMITYDDPKSINAKMNYIKSKGLKGTMVWDLETDTSDYELIKTMNQ